MSMKWLSVSHDTSVWEENYLSQRKHIWQGDTLKISAHMVGVAVSAEQDPHGQAPREIPHVPAGGSSRTAMYPLTGSWANSPLGIRGIKVFIEKTQKAGVHRFQGITEAGSSPLLRQPSSTPCWSPLVSAGGGSSLLDWGLRLPCWPPGSGDPSLQDSDRALAHWAVSQTCRLRPWSLGFLSPIDCCVYMLYFS